MAQPRRGPHTLCAMRLRAVLGVALRRLRQRPVRTFLLLQGTVWGVAVAIFPSAVLQGTRDAARTQGAELGADRISIAADPTSAREADLRPSDLALLRKDVEASGTSVRSLGGVRIVRTSPRPGAEDARAALTVLESTPGAGRARGLSLRAGRWLEAGDGPERCLVEAGVAAWLGLDALEPGARIRLPGAERELEVVGVAQARSAQTLRTSDLGFDLEHPMYANFGGPLLLALGIPLVSDGWKRTERCVYVPLPAGADTPLQWIFLRVGTEQVSETAGVVREAFARREKAAVTLYPLVLPVILGGEVDRFQAVQLAMFLACLVMGAVVMMNLGLLNVLTRSREIAIRRTEGATQPDIARQFLFEGLLLAAIGAAFGLVLGMGLAQLRVSLEPVAGFTWSFPWLHASFAVLVALGIGLLAAWIPARRASRQDPVEGLADE